MQNLYWKKNDKLRLIEEIPFKTEEELEQHVIGEGKDALTDIFILKRQVRAGHDIPDIVAMDRDNNVVIIENKNVTVDEDIVPQILRYAIWAEKYPDSIKALWLEAKDQPDDFEPDFDKLNVRIIIIAPRIKLSVARFIKKLNYKVDLIEVKKFRSGNEEFVLLNQLDDEPDESKKTVKGLEVYDKEFYCEHRNKNSVDKFIQLANELETIVKSKDWKLERKFAKGYVGFKHGFFVVFGIYWVGSKSLGIFLKAPSAYGNRIKRAIAFDCDYHKEKELLVKIDNKFNLRKMIPAFELCYKLAIEG